MQHLRVGIWVGFATDCTIKCAAGVAGRVGKGLHIGADGCSQLGLHLIVHLVLRTWLRAMVALQACVLALTGTTIWGRQRARPGQCC